MSAESPLEDLPRRRFADIDWQPRDTEAVEKGAAVTMLSESGDVIHLVTFLGVIRYSRSRDSEAVAKALETAARAAREAS